MVPSSSDQPGPAPRNLVLVGGGHAHVFVLRNFGMRPVPDTRLILVARDVETPYSGMLPGLLAGHYRHDDCHLDLMRLAGFARARLIHAEAVGIDRAARRLLLRGRPPIGYDILSLDIGSTPGLTVPGAAENAVPLKPIDRLERRWRDLERRIAAANRPWRVAVVGGGAAGVEVALAARHRLSRITDADVAVALLTRGRILAGHGARARRLLLRHLRAAGIELREHAEIVSVDPGAVRCADGRRVPADTILWATGAAPASWLADTGLELDGRGFVAVDPCLRSITDPRIFAAGDVASIREHPREKAGVFAVRQGPPLARNLRRAIEGRPLLPFAPQGKALSLIGTGGRHAVASRGPFAAEGRWVWTLKEAIDRRWMRGYRDLPAMPPSMTTGTAEAMRCAGCGAKVPGGVLSRSLGRLRKEFGAGAVPEEPEDAAIVELPAGPMLQTVDFFPAMIDDPFVFGQIAANHALGDIHAMGGLPVTALALAALPHDGDQEEDLYQMLHGALVVLREAGARLIGGHSAELRQTALGFAVTGVPGSGSSLRKSGLRPGDRLVLTKALGTGTLLAAAMHGRAKARWISGAIASMRRSTAPAARVLAAHGAAACTDVTGFGLGGHLLEMLRASGVDAEIAGLPVLEGAAETVGAGILSTAHAGNARIVALRLEGGTQSDLALLCDPQTAGGLLAGVPADRAEACVDALRAGGDTGAATIGTVLPLAGREPAIRLVFGQAAEPVGRSRG